MVRYFILLMSVLVGSVDGSCSTLATDIQTCYTNSGLAYSTNTIDTFSTFLNDCSKTLELTTCIAIAYSTCETITAIVQDAVGIKAAFTGVCAKKEVFQAGLTCMANSGVNATTLVLSCMDLSTLVTLYSEVASGNWQNYCSYMVTVIDCYMNGYTCNPEFETAYKNFQKALLPSKCRDYATSYLIWIAIYGTASMQMYSLTLMIIVTTTGLMAPYFL